MSTIEERFWERLKPMIAIGYDLDIHNRNPLGEPHLYVIRLESCARAFYVERATLNEAAEAILAHIAASDAELQQQSAGGA